MKSEVFQQLFDHGIPDGDAGETRSLLFRVLRRKGADFILLPMDDGMAVKALTLYAPQNFVPRLAVALLRLFLRLGLAVPLAPVEIRVNNSSPLIDFFTDALNLSGLGATDFAIIAGNPKDAARRYVFLLFDTLHRPALVVKVGLRKEGAATVGNEYRFLKHCASEDGVIPEPMGSREAEGLAAFALKYQPGFAPPHYEGERLLACLDKWVLPEERTRLCDLPLWDRLEPACAGIAGFGELADSVKRARLTAVIFHGDFAPWNIKVRPEDGSWVVLDWERGEQLGIPAWDWFHYVVQSGVLVEDLNAKTLRARLFHIMDSNEFTAYATRTGIDSIKLEILLLYLLHSIHVLDQARGRERLISLYNHLLEERANGGDRSRQDFHTFWAARDEGQPWLKTQVVHRAGAWLGRVGYVHRIPAILFTSLAFLVACFGSYALLESDLGKVPTAFALVPVLFFSAALVSAERMLSRVTATETRLGILFERLAGLASFVAVVSMLAWWAADGQRIMIPETARVWAFAAAVVGGGALCAVRLRRELHWGAKAGQAPRTGRLPTPLAWSTDGVLRAVLLALSWGCGMFWDFLAAYAGLLLVVAATEFAAILRQARGAQAERGQVRRAFLSARRSLSRLKRQFLFLKVFAGHKRAKMFGVGRRWVRAGIQKTPVPDKIDVVFLWKDESDGDWVERRELFLELIGKGSGYNRINRGSRATKTSLDRLKYSMRSVDKHFKPLGRIFLVTDGQRPKWLRDGDPRVVVVDQNEIFSDPKYLPSYNSQAIESYFYRIPELSEFFVYFNDDFFLNASVSGDDFYTRDGFVRVRMGRSVSARGIPTVDEEGDTSAQKNANLVLDRRFKKERRLTIMHRPYAHRKSLMERASKQFPEEFHLTRRSHFRSIEMFALHSFLIPYWAYYNGEAELMPPDLFRKDMFYWNDDPRVNEAVVERILETEPLSFCIQTDMSFVLSEENVRQYREAMDSIFPEKSSFEI